MWLHFQAVTFSCFLVIQSYQALSAQWLLGLREEQMLCVFGQGDPISWCLSFPHYKVGMKVSTTQVCLQALNELIECSTQCLATIKYYISAWEKKVKR